MVDSQFAKEPSGLDSRPKVEQRRSVSCLSAKKPWLQNDDRRSGAEGRAEGRVKSVISGKSGQIKHSKLGKRSNDAHIVISRSPEMTEGYLGNDVIRWGGINRPSVNTETG